MKTFTAMTAAALICWGAGSPALARTDVPTAKVSYADLDLSRASGRAVLEQRIRSAIERVCPPRPLPPELGHYRIYRTCKEATWNGVKPQLAAIYGGTRLAESAVRVSAGAN